MTDCKKYLGLPMVGGRAKTTTFREIQEWVAKRVLGWKEKFISKAGWEILIKTVAQSIPTYSMSLCKLPKAMCDAINSTLANYWWGQKYDERKIHWVSWQKLCMDKNRGGMGFRDINTFNLAMLAKQAWRLLQGTQSLFYRVYKARYFPNCTFLEAQLGHNPSFIWQSLLTVREVIIAGSRWKIGDRKHIGVTTHKWLSHDPIFNGEPDLELKVSDLIDEDTRQWDRGKIHALFTARTRTEILALPLNNLQAQDSPIWMENKARTFSVKTAYHVALWLKQQQVVEHSKARLDKSTWKKIRTLNVPPKVRNFIWRACSDCLPTRANLHRRKVHVEVVCGLCQQKLETTGHILWEYPLARNVWALVKGKIQKCNNEARDFFLLFGFMVQSLDPVCFHILSPKRAFWKKPNQKLWWVKPKTQLFDKSCVLGIDQKRR